MIRGLLGVAALTAGLLTFAPGVIHQTSPDCGVDFSCYYQYFSNANHTKEVGWRNVACGGTVTSEGKTSLYVSFSIEACPPGGE
jgi:hypothetical protein